MLVKRSRQFFRALFADISDADKLFVQKWLKSDEEKLFWQMNLPDQRHSLNVAYTVMNIGPNHDIEFLIRCALLHDVGRRKGDMSTFDKVFAVLMFSLLPLTALRISSYGRGGRIKNIRHALYVYRHHARISAEMLRAIGCNAEADIVELHHDKSELPKRDEVTLLQIADEQN